MCNENQSECQLADSPVLVRVRDRTVNVNDAQTDHSIAVDMNRFRSSMNELEDIGTQDYDLNRLFNSMMNKMKHTATNQAMQNQNGLTVD